LQTKEEMRKTVLTKRRAITKDTRAKAADAGSRLLLAHPVFTASQHVACYLGQIDEFDCMPIIEAIWQLGKKCYLPILPSHQEKTLKFAAYQVDTLLQRNKYHIFEPVNSETITPEKLDLVIVPLVAFDLHGHRIGMGGGYYDRTFAFKQKTAFITQPYLLGLAYELQKLPALPYDPWDVLLQGIITEEKLYDITPLPFQ
jgi:5-formyltetrahydrofolate cyclo-ligase